MIIEGLVKMRELIAIQKQEKLNNVYAVDEIGPGGANHLYMICKEGSAKQEDNNTSISVNPDDVMCTIQLQCGPRKEEKSAQGVIDTDLLEIVRDRLQAFQTGPFNSNYNAEALEGVEIALKALNKRVEDRISRNVLGKNKQ